MITLIRKLMPKSWLRFYHKIMARLAAFWYQYPSRKMVVIGVTGTNGKSTTVELVARLFESLGVRVGFTSTVRFKIAEREWLNDRKMTMLGRLSLQKLLHQMVRAGCRYAVIEVSSEGLAQFRHQGINFDVAVFLNLTPEHLEAHGGFENYQAAKAELFRHLTRQARKKIEEIEIPKVSVVNLDDEKADYFLGFGADQKIGFTTRGTTLVGVDQILRAEKIEVTARGSRFEAGGGSFKIKLLGRWNVTNALAALAVGRAFGLPLEQIRDALGQIEGIPGRMEFIDQGQNFTVLIDYAPQPQSMSALYDFLKLIPKQRIIHLLGSAGGGRDKSRRPILGELAGRNADLVIVTNEDPYDEDPGLIIEQVAAGARRVGKRDGQDLFLILDRREAIRRAVSLAAVGDLVLLTGKGAEQAIMVKNRKKIPWDEREEARKAIGQRLYESR